MSDIDREANATGFQEFLNFWSNTAPRLWEEASADIFVGAAGNVES